MPGPSSTGGDTAVLRSEVVARVLSGELSIAEACVRHGLTPESIGESIRDFRRSTVKAFDDQVRETLRRQGVDTAAYSTAELTGSLEEVEVSDLLQTLELSRRDCEICVTHDGVASRLWCANGEIVDADSPPLSGELAVYRILALRAGDMVADFRPVQRQRTIVGPTTLLLLDAARRKDECDRLHARLDQQRYAAASPPAPGDMTLSLEELELLRQFERPCAIAEVLASSTFGDLETLTVIHGLVGRARLLPAPELYSAPPDPVEVSSLRPVLVSLRALSASTATPATLAERSRGSRLRELVMGSVLAAALASCVYFALSERSRDGASSSLSVTTSPVPRAVSAVAERARVSVAGAQAAPALEPVLPGPEPAASAPPAAAPEQAARRATRAQPSAAAHRRAANAAVGRTKSPSQAASLPVTTAPWPASPRMQIIEEQRPRMLILD